MSAASEIELNYVIERASGPALIFIHGGFCNLRDWRYQLELLRGEFTVVAIDQRGHGASSGDYGQYTVESSALDIQGLLGRLQIESAILVGHSMGTRVVMQIAANQPERTLGVVLVDGSRLRSEPASASPPVARAGAEDKSMRPLIMGAFESMFCDKIDPEVKRTLLAEINATSVADLKAFFAAVQTWDIAQFERALAEISNMPILAIQSTFHDHRTKRYSLTSPEESSPWLELLKAGLSRLEIVVVPDLGHFNMMEDPQRITAEIRHFARALQDG